MSTDTVVAGLLLGMGFIVLMGLQILRGKKGPDPIVRPLPAFQELKTEVGYAAESGGGVHIALGNSSLYGQGTITSVAALQLLTSISDTMVAYDTPPVVTVGDPTLLPLAQDILRRTYERVGRAELFDPRQVWFVAPSPVAYAAGAAQVSAVELISAEMIIGDFNAEVAFVGQSSMRRGVSSLAAVAAPAAIGALYSTISRLAMGEEMFAGSAQVTGERRYVLALLTQDVLRMIIVLAILALALLAMLNG